MLDVRMFMLHKDYVDIVLNSDLLSLLIVKVRVINGELEIAPFNFTVKKEDEFYTDLCGTVACFMENKGLVEITSEHSYIQKF